MQDNEGLSPILKTRKKKVQEKGNQQVDERELDPISIQLVETMCKCGGVSKTKNGIYVTMECDGKDDNDTC